MRKIKSKSYEYIEKLLCPESALKVLARQNSEKLGLDSISISATEAEIVKFHLGEIKAQKVIEIGTLTGLSALHILDALPIDGILITIEKSAEHSALAIEVLKNEIEKKRCRVITGDAREKLSECVVNGPFDAVFIDGNKAAYLDYFQWALLNIRPGGLIFVDNIFLAGAVWGDETKQKFNPKQIENIQKMNHLAFNTDLLHSMIVPTEEGLLISKKKSL